MARASSGRNAILKSVFNSSVYSAEEEPITVTPRYTNVFVRSYESRAKTVINRGSAGSSKSYSMYQLAMLRLLTGKRKNILIIRKTLPSLRKTVLPDMYNVMEEFGVRDRLVEEKVMLNYYYKNEYGMNWLHFTGLDDPEKLKSSSWSYIFMEEATDFTLNEYLILRSRLRTKVLDGLRNQMFLSFNPIDENHWIKTNLIDKSSDVEEIHSTYKDNPFLDQDYIDDLEATREQNINFWRIMALGEWGRLEDIIYDNWDIIPVFPSEVPIVYGVDFGFNSPSVLLKIGYAETEIWEDELIYESGLTNSQFITKIKKEIPPALRNRPIYCDNAEPDRLIELKNAGLTVKPADKKVSEGIDFIKRLKVHITKTSNNIIKEKTSYTWKLGKDKKPIDEPVKFNDHAQDAERYAVYTHLKRNSKLRLRWLY